jgi:hypothetical protein
MATQQISFFGSNVPFEFADDRFDRKLRRNFVILEGLRIPATGELHHLASQLFYHLLGFLHVSAYF